jgi:hypothetical protein
MLSYSTQHHVDGSTWRERDGRLCGTAFQDALLPQALLREQFPMLTAKESLSYMTAWDQAPGNNLLKGGSMHGSQGASYMSPSKESQRRQNKVTGEGLLTGAQNQIFLMRGRDSETTISAMRAAGTATHDFYDVTPQWLAFARAATGAQTLNEALGLQHSSNSGAVFWVVERATQAVNLVLHVGHGCAVYRKCPSGQPTTQALESERAFHRLSETLRALHGLPSVLGAPSDSDIVAKYQGSHGWAVRAADGSLSVLEPRESFVMLSREAAERLAGVAQGTTSSQTGGLVSLRHAWGTDVTDAYWAWRAVAGLSSEDEFRKQFEALRDALSRARAGDAGVYEAEAALAAAVKADKGEAEIETLKATVATAKLARDAIARARAAGGEAPALALRTCTCARACAARSRRALPPARSPAAPPLRPALTTLSPHTRAPRARPPARPLPVHLQAHAEARAEARTTTIFSRQRPRSPQRSRPTAAQPTLRGCGLRSWRPSWCATPSRAPRPATRASSRPRPRSTRLSRPARARPRSRRSRLRW